MKTFTVITLGCKVNYYDSEAVIKLLSDAGYKFVGAGESADIYIINTCSVTNLSDRKSRQMLHRGRKKNKNALIIAMGCYAQVSATKISSDADIIIGTNNRKDILTLIEKFFEQKSFGQKFHKTKISDVRNENIFEEMQISDSNNRVRSFIKIQDGCDEFCSYCIIPYTRGKSRSRNFYKIFEQAQKLCANGFKEIVLTGINISAYGESSDFDLGDVIEKLHSIESLKRIRLSSVEPNLINDEFLARIKFLPKLCPHFHMSLQSGSDKILRAMNRKYTTREYFIAAEKLKKMFKNVSLTTDVIVGFPGETDKDFLDTYNFVEQIGFSKIHVFPFSSRANTRADNFTNKINSSTKKIRSTKLISLSDKLSTQYIKKFLAQNLSVLVEKKLNDEYIGYTDNYIKVSVKSDCDLINQIVDVMIIDVDKNCAIGKLL